MQEEVEKKLAEIARKRAELWCEFMRNYDRALSETPYVKEWRKRWIAAGE